MTNWKVPCGVLFVVALIFTSHSLLADSAPSKASKQSPDWPVHHFSAARALFTQSADVQHSDAAAPGTEALQDDPQFAQQWSLNNTGQQGGIVDADIDAVEAWDITTGSRQVVVGIMDAGVDYNHPDLAANIWTNPGEIPGNGIDDDSNGYVDDVHGLGDVLERRYSRGTAINGVIGAVGNNGIGISGVTQQVSMVNCRVVDSYSEEEFSDDYVEDCIDYFLTLQSQGVNIKVINISWGWNNTFSNPMEEKFNELEAAGILVVATAGWGSGNNDADPHWPSGLPNNNIIAVTSTDRRDRSEGYAFGPGTVDLGAPATSIYSTALNGSYLVSDSHYLFSAAHVSGAAALLWAAHPQLSANQVKDALMTSGDPLDDLEGRTVSGKRLNVRRALDSLDTTPSFEIQALQTQRTIVSGEDTFFGFEISALNDFTDTIEFSVETALEGVSLTRLRLPGSGRTGLRIETDSSLNWGDYEITLVGTAGTQRKTATVQLRVLPDSYEIVSYSNPADVDIYEHDLVHSDIWVSNQQTVFEVILHATFKDSLMDWYKLILESPLGTQVIQQIPTQSGYVNDTFTYHFENFYGEPATGNWRLYIDTDEYDRGTLDGWALDLRVAGDSRSAYPTASFWYEPLQQGIKFYNTSTDPDQDIVSWRWDFGDGESSNQASPLHTYAVEGYYNVNLTVTDSQGNTSTATQLSVLAAEPHLDVSGRGHITRQNVMINRIRWNGSYRRSVDIFRNGRKITTTENDGFYIDRQLGISGGRFIYKVCDRRPICSDPVILHL
ncbi:PKD domain-containing protein [Alteromonas aestuariivivens]|uniref:PKD domain-containing protein n=1 Tax=Alteromonas aestuariivivens TaxID=1938339 RepID=A0A3D8MCA1_9ALTE|nr:S8 family serine peptidase [Alteromonas aestuariivivens]RDV28042.1 PKD domain-containing protein [Alteromonas aestuariivivens]